MARTLCGSGAVVETMPLYWMEPVIFPWLSIGPPGAAEPSAAVRGSANPANVEPLKLILTLYLPLACFVAVTVSLSRSVPHTGPRCESSWVAVPETLVVSECSGEIVTALTVVLAGAVVLAEAAALGMITAAAVAAVAAAAPAARIAFLMVGTSFLAELLYVLYSVSIGSA